jgi:predicted metal-dependent peptidase
MARRKQQSPPDPNLEAYIQAYRFLFAHSMFRPLCDDPTASGLPSLTVRWVEDAALSSARGWARVECGGTIVVNKNAKADFDEWLWVLTHCALHVGFGHVDAGHARRDPAYSAACCLVVARFQGALRLGRALTRVPLDLPSADEQTLAERWRDTGVPAEYAELGVGGADPDRGGHIAAKAPALSWPDRLAIGLSAAATAAVEQAGTIRRREAEGPAPNSPWERARRWFVSSYPLLAGLAAGFRIVADRELTQQWQIAVAAVSSAAAEIYVNPFVQMPEPECRFVIAHEMLHAALRHGDRVAHRDPYLWNIATDFVINGWLVEMGVGEMPEGLLYDPELAGLSSEAVYDRIAGDLRRYRKLATLRGRGLGDVLGEPRPRGVAVDLDEYYRRALCTGLAFHESSGRGLLPSGLVDEIRVLDHPPLPWDAQLARWFEEFVPAASKRRSYARPSRRQAATPHIPRPGWVLPDEPRQRVTFGVVLDTSGSMDNVLLGKALGAIASYATARDVPAARVVFCDAAAYDAGFIPVAEIAGRVRVRGRGGTVLQPGIRLLEAAVDFPPTAPILVITDGYCDVVRIRREHAFLVPDAARLPFTPRGPVFRLS